MSLTPPPASALATSPSMGARLRATLAKLVPTREVAVDAAATVLLVGLALWGFRTTFYGLGWLWVGLGGLALGLLVAHLGATYRWIGALTALVVAALYFLLAGPLAVREDLIAGVLPSIATLSTLAHQIVGGWKELLTALSPVDSQGPYLALPFAFGLAGAALVHGIARRWRGAVVALVAPIALLALSIALGTLTPASVALQGALFGLLCIGWAAVRSNRNRPTLQNGAGATTRAVTTAALLAAATVGGYVVGPHLPGADPTTRTVLRTGLQPPYDVSQYPSPLAGFRQYTEPNPAERFDTTLLRVEGLPNGVPVRFATLDSYDGFVWGAGNVAQLGDGDTGSSFRKVGSHIGGTSDEVGEAVTAKVTIAADGYDDVWLPTFGTVTGIDFAGDRADELARDLRFNVDTETGVLPTKLRAGDQYTLAARVTPTASALPTSVDVAQGSLVDGTALTFLGEKVDAWSGRAGGDWQKVVAIAKALQDGAYTDGGAAGDYQNIFLPGHSLYRMSRFMKSTQLAGNDEQYAAALALAANSLSIPTRVVLGAIPDAQGYVKGKDVHAWVEVETDSGTWQAILPAQFLPDRNKKPEQLIQKSEEKKTGAQVPPPAANNPPSVLQGPDQAQNATQLKTPPKDDKKSPLDPSTWPDWLRWVALLLGGPLLILLLAYGAIRLAKKLRRRRRRETGTLPRRVTGGWREVIDTARDLNLPVPPRGTRLEQARALEEQVSAPAAEPVHSMVDGALLGVPVPVVPVPVVTGPVVTGQVEATGSLELVALATSANGHVFDVDEPTAEQVQAYWVDVASARKRLRQGQGWWRRFKGDLSLVTFREVKDGHSMDERLSSRGQRARDARARAAAGTRSTAAPGKPGGIRRGKRVRPGDGTRGTTTPAGTAGTRKGDA